MIWDVNRLIELSQMLPIIEVPLTDIPDFDTNYWYQFEEDIPTCQSITQHALQINNADLSYPIIINSDGHVMDGMHRVCKANILGLNTINAKRFATMPPPDFYNKKPSELDY